MQALIKTLAKKRLVGKRIKTSFTQNKTVELWRSFMPERKQLTNFTGNELYSVEVYPPDFFDAFDPTKEFEKWAAVEVGDFENLPPGMATLLVPSGLYAVFVHKGPASGAQKTYEAIFSTWLPASDYRLDSRPHFAVMGEKYKHEDPASEEEIWIPVILKQPPGLNATAH